MHRYEQESQKRSIRRTAPATGHQGQAASGLHQLHTSLGNQQVGRLIQMQGKRGLDDRDESGGKRELTPAGGGSVIQRELATPPPATAPKAQNALSQGDIDDAKKFNGRRYDESETRLIQDLVGTEPTGTWVDDDILAIARIQEEYGLKKDGMVGPTTYQFLDRETSAEKLSTSDENSLVGFWVTSRSPSVAHHSNGADYLGNFSMNALLPTHGTTSDYEYRQFIRGHFRHERGGVVTDESAWFGSIPGGRLPASFVEDGDTTATTVNYGHRAQPREDANPINRYENINGAPNQANGSVYKGEDFPGGTYRGFNAAPATGDTLDLLIQFRGEIQRRGRTIETKHWTALRDRAVLP